VFGINPAEFIVLVVVAAVVLGPERLPEYAQQLARLVRELRRMAQGASAQVRDELGPEFDDIDWRKLDPRQYDPRRIVREALSDVWDPEDPLGLKSDPLGLKDDPLGMKDVRAAWNATPEADPEPTTDAATDLDTASDLGTAWDGEKPHSAGGPATVTPTPAAFDPDAT
jgi:sec-independent protein translocase protein TatB